MLVPYSKKSRQDIVPNSLTQSKRPAEGFIFRFHELVFDVTIQTYDKSEKQAIVLAGPREVCVHLDIRHPTQSIKRSYENE
jgi:hypothetical protein